MKCPNCSHEWIPERDEILSEYARLGGSSTSRAKARAARRNAKLGGWPKGKKRGKRKPDANQIAHKVVTAAEKLTGQAFREAFPGKDPKDFKWKEYPKMTATQQAQVPPKLKALPSPKAPKRAR